MKRAHGPRIVVVLLAVCLLAGVFLVSLVSDQPPPPIPRPPAPPPPAVVTLGDSTLAGEGGGQYEAGTTGENNNWCHRSPTAPIHHLDLPPGVTRINLACSGAQATMLELETPPEHAEGSQTQRLAELATRFHVTDIVVQVGANDDPNFSDMVNRCVSAWSSRSRSGCADQLRPQWAQRVERMQPKVLAALQDVRAAMQQAHYPPESYRLTVQSYASPVGPQIPPELQNLSGCPFLTEDLQWVRETAVPQLSAGLRTVAEQVGARFLDLSRAGFGHEACTGTPTDPSREWFTRLTVDWQALKDEARAPHAMQESFHANAAGHAQFGRCLSEFLAITDPNAICLPDEQGNLHAVPDQVAALQAHP